VRSPVAGGRTSFREGAGVAKGKLKTKQHAEKPSGTSPAKAAEELGVPVAWIRAQISAGAVTPARSSDKRNARYILSDADIETLRALAVEDPAAGGPAALARLSQLEAERANLLAQVAWERAIAQEQQKALEAELVRNERLAAELDAQHARVEQLKALGVWDRMLGRHKAI
jgi:hypothetical protein